MKRGLFHHLGLYSSLLALFFYVNQPLLAQLEPDKELLQVVETSGIVCAAANKEAYGPYQEVWSKGFEREYVTGRSGMALRETTGSGQWDVLVSDENKQWVDQGTLVEDSRFDLAGGMDSKVMEQLGLDEYRRHVVVGTLIGPTGLPLQVYGIMTEFGGNFKLENGDPVAVFAPIFINEDVDLVRYRAEEFAHQVNADSHRANGGILKSQEILSSSAQPGYEKSDPACHAECQSAYDDELENCSNSRTLCNIAVAAVSAACILGCGSTGPLVVACVAACVVAEAALLAVCLDNFNNCRRQALKNQKNCEKGCLIP